jgi:hypothetical protein
VTVNRRLGGQSAAAMNRSLRAANVFAISNLGQARNAVRIAGTLGDDSAAALVLVAGSRMHFGRRLESYVRAGGLDARLVVLPETPTAPRLLLLRSIVGTYRALASGSAVGNLWLANSNAHYGVLAQLFSERGTQICYFEEGLGTYRRINDPIYRQYDNVAWRDLSGEILTTARRAINRSSYTSARGLARSLVRVGRTSASALSMGLGATAWYRRLARLVAGRQAEQFFSPWTTFIVAKVAFPDAIDRGLVRALRVEPLCMAPTPDEVVDALGMLDAAGVRPGATLFVSQPYGDRGASFYGAVARALSAAGAVDIVVRSHPREREYNLAHMISSFEQAGLRATWLVEPNGITAEALLATNRFAKCVGLTSSTLLYGPHIVSGVEFISIGQQVLSALGPTAYRADQLATLRSDIDLFESVWSIANPAFKIH